VLNLFIAILLANFSTVKDDPDEDEEDDEVDLQNGLELLTTVFGMGSKATADDGPEPAPEVVDRWDRLTEALLTRDDAREKEKGTPRKLTRTVTKRIFLLGADATKGAQDRAGPGGGKVTRCATHCSVSLTCCSSFAAKVMERLKACEIQSRWQGNAPRRLGLYDNKSLNLFLPEHPVRMWMFRVVDDRRFDYLIISLIFVSAVLMAYEHPGMSDVATHVSPDPNTVICCIRVGDELTTPALSLLHDCSPYRAGVRPRSKTDTGML
jgi:hypothetical protein